MINKTSEWDFLKSLFLIQYFLLLIFISNFIKKIEYLEYILKNINI